MMQSPPSSSAVGAKLSVDVADVRLIAGLVKRLCGIVVDDSKAYLIQHRLEPLARELGCASYSELHRKISTSGDRRLEQKLVEAMTTNETSFFRDATPFDALSYRVVPDIVDGREGRPNAKRLRIWSAAASTGQEAYSIAMKLFELIPDVATWDIKILGTDISENTLAQARSGEYSDIEIRRGLSQRFLDKYFERRGSSWVVSQAIRRVVEFRRLNLLEPFLGIGPFEIVFCRNVGIYFEREARNDLFRRIDRVVTPGGYVFLSNSEFYDAVCTDYTQMLHCGAIYYQKPGKI